MKDRLLMNVIALLWVVLYSMNGTDILLLIANAWMIASWFMD